MLQRSELPLPERCSLYQALLWVSDLVRPIEDYHFVSLPHPKTLGPTDEHKQKLLQALSLGHLKTNGTYWCDDFLGNDARNDQTLDLKPRVWKAGDVDWQNSSLRLPKPFGDTDVYDRITVPTIKLMEIFPDPSQPAPLGIDTARNSSAKANILTPTTKLRGRPEKFDWLEFHTEIAVRADLDGLPDSQAQLERVMADWCQNNWDVSPADSTIREKISPIYNHLRKARK